MELCMPKYKLGETGNPAGKPKGTIARHSLKTAAEAAKKYNIMPLDFFLGELNNLKNPMGHRTDCAKAAAPYVHRKMPIGIDDGKGGPIQFATPEQLAQLSDKDLRTLQDVMVKLAAITSVSPTPGIALGAVIAQADED
jgi:hypothetical protein